MGIPPCFYRLVLLIIQQIGIIASGQMKAKGKIIVVYYNGLLYDYFIKQKNG